MSIILDGTLQDAQDSQLHHPIVEIISQSTVPDIPFLGQKVQETTIVETNPGSIMHSTGRICNITTFGVGVNNKFRYVYTDVDRIEFFFVEIDVPSGYTAIEGTLCEITGGNLGIILYCTYSGNEKIRYLTVSPTGEVVQLQAELGTFSTASHVISSPFVAKLVSGTYLFVYVDKTISGATYAVRKRTSTNFSTWTAEDTCSIGGLTATKRIANLNYIQISTSSIWLWFDYLESVSESVELTNIYYSASSNDGVTWSSAVQWSLYNTYESRATHPVSTQKIAGQMHVIYNEISSMLTMKAQVTPGWTGVSSFVQYLQIDEVTGRMYVSLFKYIYMSPQAITAMQINLATWLIEKVWNYDTLPAFPIYWRDSQQGVDRLQAKEHAVHGEKNLIPFISGNYGWRVITVLDANTDTITNYYFEDHPLWNPAVVKNVNCSSICDAINSVWIDHASSKMYILLQKYVFGGACSWSLGYIDLNDISLVKTYTEITSGSLNWYEFYFMGYYSTYGVMKIEPEADYAILYWGYRTMIVRLSDGLVIKEYSYTTPPYGIPPGSNANANYPLEGLKNGKYINGKIWGVYRYQTGTNPDYDLKGWHGFCEIDITTNVILHHQPSWNPDVGNNHYGFDTWSNVISIDDGERIVLSEYNLGISIYDIASGTWILYNNVNVPGLLLVPWFIIYRTSTEMIYTGFEPWQIYQLVGFSINGLLNRSRYSIGNVPPLWADSLSFCQGLMDYDAVVCLDSDKSIYAFWVEQDLSEKYIKWGKESSSLDLSEYLAKGEEIIVTRTIDGSPSSLEFTISHGHIFDPYNLASLYSIYLKKTRKLKLRLGEEVLGTEYWDNLDSEKGCIFFVSESSLSFERGKYPSMHVKAEDIRSFWADANVTTIYFPQISPKLIIEDLLTDIAGLTIVDDFNIPVFDNSTLLDHQWVETGFKDILDQICERYGYFLRIDKDGLVTTKKIDNLAAVNHIYPNLDSVVRYTPDDSYSNLINQITVSGESIGTIQVLYPEEAIRTLQGTIGWWVGKREEVVYYSNDRSRRCIYPRLEVIMSVKNFNFKMTSGSESISYTDPNFLYCTVTINAPNMTNIVIALIAVIAAIVVAVSFCDGYITGWCWVFISLLASLLTALLTIMCSVANYSYQIWAQPYGDVKQSCQATWNDYALQSDMGFINLKKITDSLCYTAEDCQVVANFEGLVTQLQRSRIKIDKTAHLQDEEGDIIQINHPYSNNPMKLLVTNLTRKLLLPASSGGEGSFVDSIEGWKI